MQVEEIIKKLNLIPHPEGGFFCETYRSEEKISEKHLPVRYKNDRNIGTCIYYLLTKDTFSAMHKLKSDEIFHFYLGDPVRMLNLFPDGSGKIINLGCDLSKNYYPQVLVNQNVWQGSRLVDGGVFALLGTTVSPGFEFADYETGNRSSLINHYPEFKEMISKLTR
jgi:uncharacterized protein